MKYVSFELQGRAYGLPMGVIQEITKLLDVTAVPGTAPELRGLINLRGRIIALMDPAVRLAGLAQAPGPTSRLLIVRAECDLPPCSKKQGITSGPEPAALLVHRVHDVVDIDKQHVVPPPAHTSPDRMALLSGVYRGQHGLITLLSPAGILGVDVARENAA